MATYMSYVYWDQTSVQFYEQIGKPLAQLYAVANNGSYFPADPMEWGSSTDRKHIQYEKRGALSEQESVPGRNM